MNRTGTCTTEVFAATSGAALQLVLTSTNLYVRTAEPSIHGFTIP